MKKTAIALMSALVLLASCKKDKNDTTSNNYSISASMSAAQEVPTNSSPGTGTVTGTYDPNTNTLNYTVSWSNLTGPATNAHFHGPAAAGSNASVVVPFTLTAGSNTVSGSTTLTDAQETDLLAGKWYANVHTSANPGGEIRGQVTATR